MSVLDIPSCSNLIIVIPIVDIFFLNKSNASLNVLDNARYTGSNIENTGPNVPITIPNTNAYVE